MYASIDASWSISGVLGLFTARRAFDIPSPFYIPSTLLPFVSLNTIYKIL